jgi:hypothetical protein
MEVQDTCPRRSEAMARQGAARGTALVYAVMFATAVAGCFASASPATVERGRQIASGEAYPRRMSGMEQAEAYRSVLRHVGALRSAEERARAYETAAVYLRGTPYGTPLKRMADVHRTKAARDGYARLLEELPTLVDAEEKIERLEAAQDEFEGTVFAIAVSKMLAGARAARRREMAR